MFKNIFLLAFLALPQLAQANFSLNPALGMYKTDSDNSQTSVEIRMGYTFDFGLYLGGFYNLGSQKFIEDADEFFVGATVGYQYGGTYLLGSYIVSSEQDLKSGGIKYSGGDGFQFTLGYRALVTEDVYLGPELTYRSVSYDTIETQGLAGPSERDDDVIIPSIAVQFVF